MSQSKTYGARTQCINPDFLDYAIKQNARISKDSGSVERLFVYGERTRLEKTSLLSTLQDATATPITP